MKNAKRYAKYLILTMLIVLLLSTLVACNEEEPIYIFEDNIHFLNVGHADCIIITSQNECAIIDAGHGRDWLEDDEFAAEDVIVPYLEELFGENEIKLKFAMATHTHKDHMSGFLDLVDYENIEIDTFYMKRYNDSGNEVVYDDLVDKLNERDIPIDFEVEDLQLNVGNFDLKVFNGQLDSPTDAGDNDNSLAILATYANIKTFLAGDICNINGDEEKIAPLVGDVDILKVPHHAHYNSTSEVFMNILMPEYAIVTNRKFTSTTVYKRLVKHCEENVYLTCIYGNIVINYTRTGYTLTSQYGDKQR